MAPSFTRLLPVRIPTLTGPAHPPAPNLSLNESVELVADYFVRQDELDRRRIDSGPDKDSNDDRATGQGRVCVLTGAGVSVDSGIRAYRGEGGSYTVNKKHRPIFYQEFIDEEAKRRRYWARSYLGYPPVRVAEPNPTHFALGALMKLGYVSSIITQNVDGLHHKAHDTDLSTYLSQANVPTRAQQNLHPPPVPDPPILELHGTLRHAGCLSCGTLVQRDLFQDRLSELNPLWKKYSDEVQAEQRKEKLNPDGDVELGEGVKYEDFVVPACQKCGGPMKPKVTFFGESLEPQVRDLATHLVSRSSSLLVIGSSLATFSAFRLIRAAKDDNKVVGLINVGESRGDPVVDWRVGWKGGATDVLPQVVRALMQRRRQQGLLTDETENEVERMLRSGVVRKVGGGSGAA